MTNTPYNPVMHHPKVLRECCQRVASLAGDAAEIGVYQGASAKLICGLLPHATVHLFDTFCGMPDICQLIDDHQPGDFGDTSLERVRATLNGCTNYRLYPGVFPATAIDVPLSFVHIDCDLYRSTADALAWSWRNLVPGGIMVCDDYKCSSCKGAYAAVNEFKAATAVQMEVSDRLAILVKEAHLCPL